MRIREVPQSEILAAVERLTTMPARRCRKETGRCYVCGWPILHGELYRGRGDLRAHAYCIGQYLLDTEEHAAEAKGDAT